MGLTADQLALALEALGAGDPAVAAAVARVGIPPPRQRPPGAPTLIRTIVGQQVSVASARAIIGRLEALIGEDLPLGALAQADNEELRAVGLSRQKAAYLRSLGEEVGRGHLDLDTLPADDEEAIASLVRVKGIGRWSAEVYLLFAEGRPDIWPAGDLAVQASVATILGLSERPKEKALRAMADRWRPYRGAMAIFSWHHYNAGDGVAL